MGLIDKLFLSGVWTPSLVRGANVSGSSLTSAQASGTGEEISDTYTLTVSARSGGTGTITIATGSPNNPYSGRVAAGLNFNGTTQYTNVIPGVTLVFATAGANGNTSLVTIGNPYGAFDASSGSAGTPVGEVKHKVTNDGASSVTGAKAKLLTQAIWTRIVNKLFNYVVPFAIGATEKTTGGGSNQVTAYAMTVSGIAGSGPTKTADLNVDGVVLGAASILDLTTGSSVSGTGLKAITPAYPYRIQSGPLTGLEFAIDSAVVNSDEANVLIFNSRYIQIAPDVTGVAGTYGTADVDLTESGQATGVITAAGEAYYWTRFLVPTSANNESNPYPAKVALTGSQSTSAGWGS